MSQDPRWKTAEAAPVTAASSAVRAVQDQYWQSLLAIDKHMDEVAERLLRESDTIDGNLKLDPHMTKAVFSNPDALTMEMRDLVKMIAAFRRNLHRKSYFNKV